MSLFAAAYVCNLVATPLDDQLTYEFSRIPSYWQLPLAPAFTSRLALWHALNLARAAACGAAWALVCYRASPRVVLGVAAARGGGGGLGGGGGRQAWRREGAHGAVGEGGGNHRALPAVVSIG
jgi:hypothetical protein